MEKQKKVVTRDSGNQSQISQIKLKPPMKPPIKCSTLKVQSHQGPRLSCFASMILTIRALRSKSWYNGIYVALTITLIIALTLTPSDPNSQLAQITKRVQYFCHCGFIIFVIIRLLSFQPIHAGWCLSQFLSFVSGLATIFVQDQQTRRYLYTFSCLRALIIVRTTQVFEPFCKFVGAFKNVATIVLPVFIVVFFYSIIGLCVFSRNYPNNGCQLIIPDNYTYFPSFTCPQNTCSILTPSNLTPACLSFQQIKNLANSKNTGTTLLIYSDIFYSFYNSYKIVFLAGWSRLAHLQKDKINEAFVFIFYISFIYLVSFIHMDILSGMMMVNEQENVQQQKIKLQLQIQSQMSNIDKSSQIENKQKSGTKKKISFIKYEQKIEDFKQNSNIAVTKKALHYKTQLKYDVPRLSRHSRNPSEQILQVSQQQAIKTRQQMAVYGDKLSSLKSTSNADKDCSDLLQKVNIVYRYVSLAFICICCLNLSIQTKNLTITDFPVRNLIDFICIVEVFVTSFILLIQDQIRIMRLEMNSKRRNIEYQQCSTINKQLCCQIMIVVATIAGLLNQTLYDNTNPLHTYPVAKLSRMLRSIKYLRIYKVFKFYNFQFLEDHRILVQTIFKVLKKTIPYILFYLLMLLIFSLISFNMFSYKGQQKYAYNFKEVFYSFILVFNIFCNGQQESIIFQQYGQHGAFVIVFHIVCVTIGFGVLSKYFMTLMLSQLLDQFDKKCHQNSQEVKKVLPPNQPFKKKGKTKIDFKLKLKQIKMHQQDKKNDQFLSQSENKSNFSAMVKNIQEKGRQFLKSRPYLLIHTAITIISVAEVGLRHPLLNRSSQTFVICSKIQIFLSICYILQLLIDCLLFGVICSESSYFRRIKTHFLSFIICVVCLIGFLPYFSTLEIINTLKKFKFIRMYVSVEYFCQLNYRMKLTIIGFIKILPRLLKIFVIVYIFYAFFGILMASGFSQQMYQCHNTPTNTKILTKADCFNNGGDWISNSLSTDYSTMSTINLLTASITQSWDNIISPISRIKGKDLQMQQQSQPAILILCVFGYLIGSFILLNVFIGYALYQMKNIQMEETGQKLLNQFQKNWLCVKEQIYRLKVKATMEIVEGTVKHRFWCIVSSKGYKIFKVIYMLGFVILVSLINSVISWENILLIYKIALGIMVGSLLLSIAEQIGNYRQISILFIVYEIIFYGYSIGFFYSLFSGLFVNESNAMICGSIFVALQLIQYWLYIIRFQFISKVLRYLKVILPRSIYIFTLMIVMLTTYTLIANQLFAYIALPNRSESSNQLDISYSTTSLTLFNLIKFSTWQFPMDQILLTISQQNPLLLCVNNIDTYEQYLKYGQNGCGSKWKSYVFFISFHILYTLIMHSALMANIFDSYLEAIKQERILLKQFQLDKVTKQWEIFDKNGEGFISYVNFWRFVTSIFRIYGANNYAHLTADMKSQLLKSLNITIYNYKGTLSFQFYQTIEQLLRYLLQKKYKYHRQAQQNENKADKIYNKLNCKTCFASTCDIQKTEFTSKHVFSIIIVKKILKRWHDKSTDKQHAKIFQKIHKIIRTNLYSHKVCDLGQRRQ